MHIVVVGGPGLLDGGKNIKFCDILRVPELKRLSLSVGTLDTQFLVSGHPLLALQFARHCCQEKVHPKTAHARMKMTRMVHHERT